MMMKSFQSMYEYCLIVDTTTLALPELVFYHSISSNTPKFTALIVKFEVNTL